MDELLFDLRRVSVAFRGNDRPQVVLDDCSLRIRQGEFLAIVGRNGSGKSTLGRVLAGLCPISLGEYNRAVDSSRDVSIVLQNPDAQLVGETVYEDLCFGMENRCIPPEQMQARALAALAEAGLHAGLDTPTAHLSGGQKQLLCLAGALAVDAKAFILDEVTAMLDGVARQTVLRAAARLHRQGKTVIWITQLMDELSYAGRVAALESGRLAFDGTAEQFFYEEADRNGATPQNENHDGSWCGMLGFPPPYAVEVARQLIRLGWPMDEFRPLRAEQLARAVGAPCL
ncbi:ATP-binding cassette domain-containing protein [Paenibacillus sp. y28]|uniref:ATP-binding cassette domain-containing protein n=1 Tax=Paenibacillus sp. y28 TaxID=3129110 RepID=UPI003015A2E6